LLLIKVERTVQKIVMCAKEAPLPAFLSTFPAAPYGQILLVVIAVDTQIDHKHVE
jgi:hypothetical protein